MTSNFWQDVSLWVFLVGKLLAQNAIRSYRLLFVKLSISYSCSTAALPKWN